MKTDINLKKLKRKPGKIGKIRDVILPPDPKDRKGLVKWILCAILIICLLGIISGAQMRRTNMKKAEVLNQNAKTLYTAAQNRLWNLKTDGQLDKWISQAKASGVTKASAKKSSDGPEYFLGSRMTKKPSGLEDSAWDPENSYYLVFTPGADQEEGMIRQILPFGAVTEDLRSNGSYILEYNAKTAQVYGVYYTDAKTLSWKDASAEGIGRNPKIRTSIKKRLRYFPKGRARSVVLGYWGTNKKVSPAGKLEAPVVTADSGDELKITVVDPNQSVASDTSVSLVIEGLTSHSKSVIHMKLTDTSAVYPKSEYPSEHLWKVMKLSDGSFAYTAVLDDITDKSGHFAQKFPNMIPGENLKIRAMVSSDSSLTETASSKTIQVSSLFGAGKTEKDVKNVKVSSVRHLENMDPLISGIPTEESYELTSNSQKNRLATGCAHYLKNPADTQKRIDKIEAALKVKQTASIRFSDFQKNTADSSHDFQIYTKEGKAVTDSGTFFGVYNSQLKEYDGDGHSLKHFRIREASEEIRDEMKDMAGIEDAGLFRMLPSSDVEVKDLKLTQTDVRTDSGSGNAGALTGELYGPMTDSKAMKISGVVSTGAKVYSKGGNAGGLAGKLSAAADEAKDEASPLTVESCGSQASVSAPKGTAGGLVGSVSHQAVFSSCWTLGRDASVSDGKLTGGASDYMDSSSKKEILKSADVKGVTAAGFAGEITGIAGVSFRNCLAEASAAGEKFAGGFFGQDDSRHLYHEVEHIAFVSNSYRGCFSAGGCAITGTADEGAFAGIFGGYVKNRGAIEFTSCRYLTTATESLERLGNVAQSVDLRQAAAQDLTSMERRIGLR